MPHVPRLGCLVVARGEQPLLTPREYRLPRLDNHFMRLTSARASRLLPLAGNSLRGPAGFDPPRPPPSWRRARAVGRRFPSRHTPRRNATRFGRAAHRARNGQCAGGHGGGEAARGRDARAGHLVLFVGVRTRFEQSFHQLVPVLVRAHVQANVSSEGVCMCLWVALCVYQPRHLGPVVGLARIVQLLRIRGLLLRQEAHLLGRPKTSVLSVVSRACFFCVKPWARKEASKPG